MSSQLADITRNTTDLLIKGWEAWKLEPIMATWASECIMVQVPASLNIPVRKIDEFRAWLAGVESQLSDCKVTMTGAIKTANKADYSLQITTHDQFASVEERRPWLHCSMTADHYGSSYENEYMFVLSFDEEGLTKIVEMVDSQRVREAWSKVPEVEFTRR